MYTVLTGRFGRAEWMGRRRIAIVCSDSPEQLAILTRSAHSVAPAGNPSAGGTAGYPQGCYLRGSSQYFRKRFRKLLSRDPLSLQSVLYREETFRPMRQAASLENESPTT